MEIKDFPDKEGWWWRWCDFDKKWEAFEVWNDPEDGWCYACYGEGCGVPIKKNEAKWAGPIQPPEGL